MSFDSLALLRPHAGADLSALAEQHVQHDLTPADRDVLQTAASKFGLHTGVGTALGLGAGLFLAFRARAARRRFFEAFRAAEKPTHVQFANGRTEALPDVTPMMQPSTAGDIAAYVLFAAGGLFLGGEAGALSGAASARRAVARDPDASARIEAAFRNFRADVLRRELARVEGEAGPRGVLDGARAFLSR